MEEFGTAITEAQRAIAMDPAYTKGHYRLGSAQMALGHFKDARKTFRCARARAPPS
jgi:serine/threonine-protein phosphatase 5